MDSTNASISNFQNDRPRTPLASKLSSLLAASPRNSLDSIPASDHSSDDSDPMRPRLSPKRARTPVDQLAQLPVLRWLGQWADGSSSQPSSQPSSPKSPAALIQQAIDDDVFVDAPPTIQRPAQAHFSSSGLHSTALRRAPPFFENLARATMPTSSVTRDLPAAHLPPDGIRGKLYPIAPMLLNQPPPSRTSIDALRTLRDRGMGLQTNTAQTPGVAPGPSFSTLAPSRWWWDNKTSVDNLLDETDQGDTVDDEGARIKAKYQAPKNPVVFCHGLLGFDSIQIGPSIAPVQVSHWRGIKEVLESNGIEVLITRVPATSSPMERAKVLEAKISETYPGRAVHLIGHSMGGLDSRYLTTHLKHRRFSVLSVTTVGTPHRGSPFADHFIATIGKERMPSVLALIDLLPNGGGDGKAFESLTLESMRRFNEQTPDVPGVQYFSWGAQFEPGLMDAFRWPWSVILEREGPNDGLVSVKSAQWGTYLGTLDDVNHLDLVGWINAARYKWAEFTGREIKFKPATFYLGVADHLARVVEGAAKEQHCDGSESKFSKGTSAGSGVKTAEGVEQTGSPTPQEQRSLDSKGKRRSGDDTTSEDSRDTGCPS